MYGIIPIIILISAKCGVYFPNAFSKCSDCSKSLYEFSFVISSTLWDKLLNKICVICFVFVCNAMILPNNITHTNSPHWGVYKYLTVQEPLVCCDGKIADGV